MLSRLTSVRRLLTQQHAPASSAAVLAAIKDYAKFRSEEITNELKFRKHEMSDEETTQANLALNKLKTPITDQTKWLDLGFDDLDQVEVLLMIEDALQVRFPDSEFNTVHGVSDAVQVTNKYLSK
jgi:acyl carrier protein